MEYYGVTRQLFKSLEDNWKLILFPTIIFALYFHYTSNFDFFKKKGIPFMKPVVLLGNLGPRIRGTVSFHDYQLQIYNYFRGHRYGGIFEGRNPVLYIFDTDLIKAITIRDFDHFTNRNKMDNKPRFLNRSLLYLKGAEWKAVRSAVTPAFSSARLKTMLPLLELCSKQMVEYMKQNEHTDVEMKTAMGHFTLEAIGACAFGIKFDALTDNNSHFFKVAAKLDYMSNTKRIFIFTILMCMPTLINLVNFSLFNMESMLELLRILKAAKAERRLADSQKNDFLQILVDVAKKESENNSGTLIDDDAIDGQCLIFLIAGYETSSTLLSFAIYVLAIRPDLQEKLRAHINEISEEKELSYELLSEMSYLDSFLMETLRMYPPISRFDRVVTKPYTLPNSSVRLNTGDVVVIPVYPIHMDPKHYPEPHEFRPERFMGNEMKERHSHLFLAFGAGPRHCIGQRFAMTSAKVAMVYLMKNLQFTASPKTKNPVAFDKRARFLKTAGLWVRVETLQ